MGKDWIEERVRNVSLNSRYMIVIESKRKKLSTLEREYPGAVIVDVTSHANGEMVRFSPFYPHGGIPVPYSGNITSMSVEGIWQGLKVFGTAGVDRSSFRNATMKDLKRTTRRFGPTLGHRKGVDGTELLGYLEGNYPECGDIESSNPEGTTPRRPTGSA